MADNNYCACNSGESKYTIKLNQQGPAGKKGEQGDKGIPGFSPYISVVQSDDENYILRINNEANSYNTPNLFPKDQVTTWTNNIEAQVNQNTTDISNIETQVQQNTTDLSNIKPQVQQNTTDLSKINGNYVTLSTSQEISGRKRFIDEYTEFSGVTNTSSFYNEYGKIRIEAEYSEAKIRFNSNKIGTSPVHGDYFNGACIYFSYTDNRLYYLPNSSSQDGITLQGNELAVKGDLPKLATTTTAGIVKPDRKTITISDDGALTANYLVPQTYTNNSGEEVNKFLKLTINKNSLQSSSFTSNDLILTYCTTTFENGVQIGGITNEFPITTFLKATVDKLGTVKPDGTTVTINSDGVISAVGEVSQQELADGLALKVNLTDYNNRVGSLESTVGEQAQTIATLQENNTRLLEMINALKDRVTTLETMIDGGNA